MHSSIYNGFDRVNINIEVDVSYFQTHKKIVYSCCGDLQAQLADFRFAGSAVLCERVCIEDDVLFFAYI